MSSTKDNRHDDLAVAISRLTCEICAIREQRAMEFQWFRAHMELATKADLKEAERRIIATIEKGGRGGISKEDEQALASLLERNDAIVKKIEALDAKTPPAP